MPEPKPTIFFLHGLGLSGRAFDDVSLMLADAFETVAIDLPGFGNAPATGGSAVVDMAAHVAERIAAHGAARWLLVGHSMGGKLASIVAAQAVSGAPGLFGLAGVVLLAASPPSPEPIVEERRRRMIGWASDGPFDEEAITEFIDANTAAPLPADRHAAVANDLKRMSREAWLAWLDRGSREDWSDEVGTLDLPALILVGSEDGDLGEAGQRATNLPVYPRAEIQMIDRAGHFLMLERPAEVADRIRRFWRERAGLGPAVPRAYARMIASDRVSRRTRAILARRILADPPDYRPAAVTPAQLATLRAVAACVVPHDGPPIDLAARLDRQLADGRGDGWRHADLPPDAEACRHALDALDGFASLASEAQEATLVAVAEERFDADGASLSPAQMAAWFEDARNDLVRHWLAHPATMARIGFDGFANGGDGVRKQGFELIGAGEREAWEPLAGEAA